MEYQQISLNDYKIAGTVAQLHDDRITKAWKNSQQNNSETVANKNDKETRKEKYLFLDKRQKIFDNLDINIIVW